MNERAHGSEVAAEADFSIIRYAQCWEDADVLLEGLEVQPGEVCLSVGSGGDNSLSLLTRAPSKVIVVDLSPAQIACLELKVAGYKRLSHPELLTLFGAAPAEQRLSLYERLRDALSPNARLFWDARRPAIAAGIGSAGKFEAYFALFRKYVLPLIHSAKQVDALFVPRSDEERRRFYEDTWSNRRWRALFRVFFSRRAMAWLGRDPRFFKYVEGGVAEEILGRCRHALIHLDPSANPYLQWIAYGRFTTALPHALRPQNFELIREHIDRLEWRLAAVEEVLAAADDASIDRFNMSDVFEYLGEPASDALFSEIVRSGRRGGRVAYWNLLACRRHPESLAARLRTLDSLGRRLHWRAKAFFYGAFIVDELT